MRSFYEFTARLNEEILRQIQLQNAIKRTGIDPRILQMARKVMTINEFLEKPPNGARGAYALGLSSLASGARDIYSQIAKAFGMVEWPDAYKNAFGATWWQKTADPAITDRFLDQIIDDWRTIVFFAPNDALNKSNSRWRYTREELEYFIRNPAKLKKVIFVLGTYDMIEPDDYNNMVVKNKDSWRGEEEIGGLMQDILKNPTAHKKPGQSY